MVQRRPGLVAPQLNPSPAQALRAQLQPLPSAISPAGELVPSQQTPSSETQPIQAKPDHDALLQDTVSQWIDQGIQPDQALAFIGLGLMRRMVRPDQDPTWTWTELEPHQTDLAALRQRLELTQLAIDTGAPLTTAEVTQLMGARPGAPMVERGGLRARRLSRNVWKLTRSSEESQSGGSIGLSDGFRRRL